MEPTRNQPNHIRLALIGVAIILVAFWAGAQWGPRGPQSVSAVPADAQTAAQALTNDEATNVRIYREVNPGVANIVTRAVEYDFFFGPVPTGGAGSGFLIDEKGHILTNYHVVENAQNIEVTFGDQARYDARLIGADQRNDVALIQIDPRGKKLAPLRLGDSSKLQVGQRVLAIGNPFGFQSTLTTGVVSALGRTVQTSQTTFIDEAVQTDAAINQGNSGGPLLDSSGSVIGINTSIYTPSGANAGIGFAIPINTAKKIANDLITDGRVHRAYLGVDVTALWPRLAEALELPIAEGMLVERVTPNSPAARAGIRGGNRTVIAGMRRLYIGGDVLVTIDNNKIVSQLDMNIALNRKRPGDEVTLTFYRDGRKQDVKVRLTEQ